jgi:aspartyl-tRNA(Asn)/glutamyl-tRNA(Gln) amidotransferase subunit C
VAVSHDDVRRIAELASIAVPPERLDELARELSGILAHMEALRDVPDVTAGEDDAQGARGMRLAADMGPSVALHRAREALAPATRDGFFLVPRLSTHDTDRES